MNKLSLKDFNGLSLIFGSIFSFIPFIIQLARNNRPEEGEHIFTFFANQIILNGNVSILNALFSIIGSTLISYGIFALFNTVKKNNFEVLMTFGLFLFLLSTVGFIIAWSQDFIIIWGDANTASNQVMIEFSLVFGFGITYWIGLSIYAFTLSRLKFLNTNFLNALSIISEYDVVIDGTDNFKSKSSICKIAFKETIPLVYGGLSQWEGQVCVFDPKSASICFGCIFI